MKQKIFTLGEQQRRDGEALWRLEQTLQGRRSYDGIVLSEDVGTEDDLPVAERLSALESKVFGQRAVSMETRRDGNVGVTSPHVDQDDVKYNIDCPGPLEVTRGKEDAASAEATDPKGMLVEVTGTSRGKEHSREKHSGSSSRPTPEQQQQQRRPVRRLG